MENPLLLKIELIIFVNIVTLGGPGVRTVLTKNHNLLKPAGAWRSPGELRARNQGIGQQEEQSEAEDSLS